MTGTAMLFPIALYRGPSAAGLPRYVIDVYPSGNPWRRSHSSQSGVSRRTAMANPCPPISGINVSLGSLPKPPPPLFDFRVFAT